MDMLLGNEFVAFHYDKYRHVLAATTPERIRDSVSMEKHNTHDIYFEIRDVNKNLVISTSRNSGTARFNNSNGYAIAIINYDKFLTSLPKSIQHEKLRCDCIMYPTEPKTDFLLAEIKDSPSDYMGRYAIKQLLATLLMLTTVPKIKAFIDAFPVKRCCIFKKAVQAPDPVTAPAAFGRAELLSTEESYLRNPGIEKFDFKLFRYSGSQSYIFNQGN
jgi:hypothetical protein